MGTNQRKHVIFVKQVVLLLILIAVCVGGGRYYLQWKAEQSFSTLDLVAADGRALGAVKVEIANAASERSRGLMFRRAPEFPRERGMLFAFDNEAPRRFWMKNTYLPLDILFFDRECRLISMLENVPTLNEQPRMSAGPAMFVLELNAGRAKELGIGLGTLCSIAGNSPQAGEAD